MSEHQKGILLVVAAGSGTGKSTVCQEILRRHEQASLSVSYTTRTPREGEFDGQHYHFIPKAQFETMIQEEQFLEYAEVHDHYYGTGRDTTLALLEEGKHVLLDIDVQGARTIRENFGPRAILLFMLPPSWDAMHQRLINRGTEGPERIQRRLKTARKEIPTAKDFDYIVINDVLEDTIQTLLSILHAEQFKSTHMQKELDALIKQIPDEL
ncbi:MAG TPA: guanylate kinase [Myxococcales bacterium]|nr:guanylate kinase [Deltaproteobacteria bacterium]HAA55959.1 guanylate kinase [Myxococcales bacterium]|tara:strand:+ start:2826 stop:3458 length:633 start_codon:yes stop_codon:yes gene_type:complete